MATANPFDLLGDDDTDDPSQLIAAVQQQKIASKKAAALAPPTAAKLPSKPLPPAQAVREARSNAGGRGGLERGGRGGRGGQRQDFGKENVNVNGYGGGYGDVGGGAGGEDGDSGTTAEKGRGPYGGPRPLYRGARPGGYSNGEAGGDFQRLARRDYERRRGTGQGYETKREGAGRRKWATPSDEAVAQEPNENGVPDDKVATLEKKVELEDAPSSDVNKDTKEGAANETEQKEEEDKEMTLEEYEKIRKEKRKALFAMKTEERRVDIDKELESMQQLSVKKGNDEFFIKLGSDKDCKRKENADRDERVRKSVSINEFLKPAEGERYYSPGSRGSGRRGGGRGFGRGGTSTPAATPSIEDPGQFPTLGGK